MKKKKKSKKVSEIGIAFVSIGAICIIASFTLINPDTAGSLATGVFGGTILGSGIAHLIKGTKV